MPDLSTLTTVLITVFVTVFVILLGVNLATAEKRLLRRPKRLYTSRDADFRRALGVLLGPPIVGGNQVKTLLNGDQIFPAMLDAIRSAQVSVTFETFIFRDEIGAQFCSALTDAAKRGVRVHVLVDWLGSRAMDRKLFDFAAVQATGRAEGHGDIGFDVDAALERAMDGAAANTPIAMPATRRNG